MNLPNYTILPGHPGSITDIIKDAVDNFDIPNELRPIRWTSSYQGETTYETDIGKRGRLTFRWGKCPCKWGYEKTEAHYWNFDTEADFQREFNGAWGILHRIGANPVDAATLNAFRKFYRPNAVTGYFNHNRKCWMVCEPTERELSTETWKQTPRYQEVCAELKLSA